MTMVELQYQSQQNIVSVLMGRPVYKYAYLCIELVELFHGALQGLPLFVKFDLGVLGLVCLGGLLGRLEVLLGLGLLLLLGLYLLLQVGMEICIVNGIRYGLYGNKVYDIQSGAAG